MRFRRFTHPIILTLLLMACNREQQHPASPTAGDPGRGKAAIEKYACQSCHNIPGMPGPKGMVGPSLDHFASRATVAGKFPNNPRTLIKWLQNPPGFDPQASMPNVGVTEADSRDISAYLYTLK